LLCISQGRARYAGAHMVLTRRQKFVMLVAICAVVGEANVPRERSRNKHRDRVGAMKDISELTDPQFRMRFRMTRNAFAGLLATIRHDLERNENMALRSSKEPVFPYLQLCIALRYLAGGSYLDIADVYKVPLSPPPSPSASNHIFGRSMNPQ
jgi:hypothetical protein